MKRREFVGGLVGAAAWPLAARAQEVLPTVGFIRSTSSEGFGNLVAAFRQGLREIGFMEGRNVSVEYHWAENRRDRLEALLKDMITRQVAVIMGNHIATISAKMATKSIPIVFASGSDPLRDQLVTSLNRPGENVTGIVFFSDVAGAKRSDLLRQLISETVTIAVLVNPNSPPTEAEPADVLAAAKSLGQQTTTVDVNDDSEIERAFSRFVEHGAGALFVGAGSFLNSHRDKVVALAAQQRLPAIYPLHDQAVAGGLMSYGGSQTDAYREAGIYVGRILNGARAADLPVVQSAKLELVINLKTARALGLVVPPSLLARADEVIE
jgi:putative ABC transport system substrate-binding protein